MSLDPKGNSSSPSFTSNVQRTVANEQPASNTLAFSNTFGIGMYPRLLPKGSDGEQKQQLRHSEINISYDDESKAELQVAVPNDAALCGHACSRHPSLIYRKRTSYRFVCLNGVIAFVCALLGSLLSFLIFCVYARYSTTSLQTSRFANPGLRDSKHPLCVQVQDVRYEERLHLASIAPPDEPGYKRKGQLYEYRELTGSLSHWAVTKEPRTGGSSSPTKARSAGSSGRGDPPTSSQPSMKLLSNGELNFTREGVVVVDSLVTAKVHPGMGLAFNLMLLAPPEEPVALAAAFEQSVGLSNPEIRLAFCSQEIGNWPPNQSGAVCEKERTCRLSGTAHVGPNWRLQLTFAVEGGLLRVWNEQGTTTMDIVFVADEL